MRLEEVLLKSFPMQPPGMRSKESFVTSWGKLTPKERAIEGLLQYKPKGKGLGEIAADIITKAARATDDVAMQAKLGLKAFLKAIPESIGSELSASISNLSGRPCRRPDFCKQYKTVKILKRESLDCS